MQKVPLHIQSNLDRRIIALRTSVVRISDIQAVVGRRNGEEVSVSEVHHGLAQVEGVAGEDHFRYSKRRPGNLVCVGIASVEDWRVQCAINVSQIRWSGRMRRHAAADVLNEARIVLDVWVGEEDALIRSAFETCEIMERGAYLVSIVSEHRRHASVELAVP